jgi:hypothetical protein
MSTIWDQPQHAGQATDTTSTAPVSGAPDVPTTGTRERQMGTQAGPLLSGAGRGIVGGVPYGETEQERAEALNAQYPFDPGFVKRARAATRQAIGR